MRNLAVKVPYNAKQLLLPADSTSADITLLRMPRRLIKSGWKGRAGPQQSSKPSLAEQHRANSFFLGWTAILLQIDDIGAAKPAKAAVPRWRCGVCAPVLFGHDQPLPEGAWRQLECSAHQYYPLPLKNIKNKRIKNIGPLFSV